MANVEMPDLGAIISTVKGRKRAYAIFAIIAFAVGNTTVFWAAAFGTVPAWLIAAGAVVSNCAPVFSALAIANAKEPVIEIESV